MLKLYLKKVLLTILFFTAHLFTSSFVYMVMTLILSDKVYLEEFRTALAVILAIPVSVVTVYISRLDNKTHKRAYMEAHRTETISFRKDFVGTLISRENIIHTLAFLTLGLLYILPVPISIEEPLWRLIIVTVILLFIAGVIFTVANTLLWCLVHKRWISHH